MIFLNFFFGTGLEKWQTAITAIVGPMGSWTVNSHGVNSLKSSFFFFEIFHSKNGNQILEHDFKTFFKHPECELISENLNVLFNFIKNALETVFNVVVDSGSLFVLNDFDSSTSTNTFIKSYQSFEVNFYSAHRFFGVLRGFLIFDFTFKGHYWLAPQQYDQWGKQRFCTKYREQPGWQHTRFYRFGVHPQWAKGPCFTFDQRA